MDNKELRKIPNDKYQITTERSGLIACPVFFRGTPLKINYFVSK